MERLMAKERELFLEEHPGDKGNGYYERSLFTSSGLIEDLRVPRTRSGEFHPAVLPGRRRAPADLGDLIPIMFQCGISTRKMKQAIESSCGTFYSHASLERPARVAEEEIEAWRMRPPKSRYFSLHIDARFLSLKRGSWRKESVLIAQGTDHEGEREILTLPGHGVGGGERPRLAGDPHATGSRGRSSFGETPSHRARRWSSSCFRVSRGRRKRAPTPGGRSSGSSGGEGLSMWTSSYPTTLRGSESTRFLRHPGSRDDESLERGGNAVQENPAPRNPGSRPSPRSFSRRTGSSFRCTRCATPGGR